MCVYIYLSYHASQVMVVRDESGVPEVLTKELTEACGTSPDYHCYVAIHYY